MGGVPTGAGLVDGGVDQEGVGFQRGASPGKGWLAWQFQASVSEG